MRAKTTSILPFVVATMGGSDPKTEMAYRKISLALSARSKTFWVSFKFHALEVGFNSFYQCSDHTFAVFIYKTSIQNPVCRTVLMLKTSIGSNRRSINGANKQLKIENSQDAWGEKPLSIGFSPMHLSLGEPWEEPPMIMTYVLPY